MKKIAIFVEGGGDTVGQKIELRNGFDGLLRIQKRAAQNKHLQWRMVPCGSRNETRQAFVAEVRNTGSETLCVLLVDSEEGLVAETDGNADLNAQVRRMHLIQRDEWDLSDAEPQQVHLMVQCMEAWIVADPETLTGYYGKGFRAKSLPVRKNLEEEPKLQIYDKLAKATKGTSKGEYSKIKHASKLLTLIETRKVASRCSRFATLTKWLDEQIENA